MKVVCGACQAKYQIPDERVAGRKLKIRCRKCGDAIVVRGDQLAAEHEEPTQTNGHHAAAVAGEWHLSIDGDQHGPYPTEQMASMLREGHVSWEAFAWREGYSDWKSAAESDTLVRAVAALQPVEVAPAPVPVPEPVDDDGPTRMVGSVPPGALAPVARSAFSARAYRAASQPPVAELAPAAAPAPAHAPAPVYSAQYEARSNGHGSSPYISAEQAMTGERHEDSVLFSTQNLQSTVSPSAIAPARNGFAGGEGSGLIDIRALAALARTSQGQSQTVLPVASATDTAPVTRRGRDEVMTLASQTGAFSNLDSLRPFETPARQSSNAVPIAIVTGSALVAAAAFFAVYLTRTSTEPQPAAAVLSQPAAPIAVEPELQAAEPAAAEPAAAEPAAAALPAAAPEPVAAAPVASAKPGRPARIGGSSRRPSRGATKAEPRKIEAAVAADKPAKAKPDPIAEATKPEPKADAKAEKGGESPSIDDLLLADAKPAKAAEPVAAAEPQKPAQPSRSRSIDELLDTAVIEGEKKGSKPEASAASAALPDSPSREQVQSAMKGVASDVKACAAGQAVEAGATATVALTVSGSNGKVSSVRVTGIQGAIGSCVARAVRGANFPKFAKESLSLNYPFRLQ